MTWEDECQKKMCQKYWSNQIGNGNNNWTETWWAQSWSHENHQVHQHKHIRYHTKQNFFIFWTNITWYHQISTTKKTWQIFTCITIQQSCVLTEPWRRNYTSTSKLMGCHYIRIRPVPVNNQDTDSIKITQSIRLWSINIVSPTGYSYKFIHIKRKLSITHKIPSSSPCQLCNYSFINSTKIKCQTYHLHGYWQWFWPSCCCCILNEPSTWSTWT